MLVPETAMHEDHPAEFAEYKIGRAGKVAPVKPIAVAERIGEPSHKHFGLRIFTSNKRHSTASFLRGQCVHCCLAKQARATIIAIVPTKIDPLDLADAVSAFLKSVAADGAVSIAEIGGVGSK